MEEIIDSTGKKHICLSKLNIKGIDFYITKGKKVYVKDEMGNYIIYNEGNEGKNVILSSLLENPKSLDVIIEEK